MKKAWVMVAIMLLLALDSHAEVIVSRQGLTANLLGASLEQSMRQISRQADIDVDVLNRAAYNNAMISEIFENVPLDQAIEQLLNGWNYGLSKDPSTGKVRMVVIGSRRKSLGGVGMMPITQSRAASGLDVHSMLNSRPMSVAENSDQLFADQSDWEYSDRDQGEDWEGRTEEEPAFQTEEELLANAPPNVRPFLDRIFKPNSQK